MATQPITPALFEFLLDLKDNNTRPWFEENKERYRSDVRDPVLDFIAAFAEPLANISPHFRADPRPNGGSLFRIYRDIRFARDKRPYKTNAGAHFRHSAGKNAHAPGFYLHLEPGECFAGCGVWRPDSNALVGIRDAIVLKPDRWQRITTDENFRKMFELSGESLKRPPRGYDPEHPLIEDLKRKDFVAIVRFPEGDACQADFLERFTTFARTGSSLVAFLSHAVGVSF